MKKIINAPERFIPEMLEGIYAAHPDELMCVGGDLHCLVSKRKHAGKVGSNSTCSCNDNIHFLIIILFEGQKYSKFISIGHLKVFILKLWRHSLFEWCFQK